jgi:hypothetical protein
MKRKSCAVCQCCRKREEYTECSERCALPQDTRCDVLRGWLSVSYWKGMGLVDNYDFCSLTCLQKWVEVQVPKIPKTFFDAFQD